MNKMGKLIIGILMGIVVLNQLVAGDVINGFDGKRPADAVNHGKYTCFSGKLVKSLWEYPTDGNDDVVWQSAIVDKKLSRQPVSFRFACGFGLRNGSAEHQLFVNNHALLSFKPQYGDFTAETADASLEFMALYIDGNDDVFGIMELKVAPELIDFGAAQKFRMLGSKANAKVWFMLSDTPLLSVAAALKLQTDNKIRRRLEIIKTIRAREQQKKKLVLRPQVCYFPNNCQAAVSVISKTTDSLAGYDDATKLMIKAAQNPAGFEDAVDCAIAKRQWLIVQYDKSNTTMNQSHAISDNLKYLKQLDCVVWSAPAGKVAEYIRMRKQAKLIIEQKTPGHLTVTLHGFPSGFKATLPLTVHVLLPDGAWDVRVVNRRKVELPSQLTVIDKSHGILFDITPGRGMVDIYYEK
jgi:hypothetical protein